MYSRWIAKKIIHIAILAAALYILGCGNDEPSITVETTNELVGGLSGNTYICTRFGITIPNLPVDEWTVKELGSNGQGIEQKQEPPEGYVAIPLHHLLLMEPVTIDEFVGLDEKASLKPIMMKNIPFIWVGVEVYTEEIDLSKNLDSYIKDKSASVESREFVEIGGITGIQAVLIRGSGLRESLIWFAKRRLIVRCEYLSNETDFYNLSFAYS